MRRSSTGKAPLPCCLLPANPVPVAGAAAVLCPHCHRETEEASQPPSPHHSTGSSATYPPQHCCHPSGNRSVPLESTLCCKVQCVVLCGYSRAIGRLSPSYGTFVTIWHLARVSVWHLCHNMAPGMCISMEPLSQYGTWDV